MRYHWGLGVGHYHAHQGAGNTSGNPQDELQNTNVPHDLESGEERPHRDSDILQASNAGSFNNIGTNNGENGSDASDSDDGELGLDDRQQEGWEDVESEDSETEGLQFLSNAAENELEDHTGL